MNVRISNYAERSKLAQNNIPTKYIETLIDRGMGINVKILGWGRMQKVLLKLSMLPYLEVHVRRNNNTPFLDEGIGFPQIYDDECLKKYTMKELFSSKGDPVAYVEILMKFYQRKLKMPYQQ